MKSFLQILSKIDDAETNKSKAARRRGAKSNPIEPSCRCCKYMKISSTGPVLEIYPSVLGTYENIKEENECPLYKLKGKKRFLTRPEGFTESKAHVYTWGVNTRVGATWGWIKGLEDQPCPHMVTNWGIFLEDQKKWVVDRTLEIKCSTVFGE